MFLSQKTVEAVKERSRLDELIGEVVQLKRTGSRLSGLCPFHAERSPSFYVNPDRGSYHCFGCGASGDAIAFLMQFRGLSFVDAVVDLANRLGIQVEKVSPNGAAKDKDQVTAQAIYKINLIATEFFCNQLLSAPAAVKDYIALRGLDEKALSQFGVGYAPLGSAGQGPLEAHLRRKGIDERTILASGLVRRSERGDFYDFFRGRIIFPVWIDANRVVAFGGRVVPALLREGEKVGKYINTPETAVYQKHKVLYGLPFALQAIREQKRVYVVEGYLDVISLMLAGVNAVVATCGTALTEKHIERLSKLAPHIVLLFDGDTAGRAAAAKSFDYFLNSKAKVDVLFLPQGKDPDNIAREFGDKSQSFLDGLPTLELIDCFIEAEVRKNAGDKGLGEQSVNPKSLGPALRGVIGESIAKKLAMIENSIERGELAERASMKLQVSAASLTGLVEDARAGREFKFSGGEREQQTSGGLHVSKADIMEGGSTQTTKAQFEQLPKVDRELLLLAMAGRVEYCQRILQTPELAASLTATTLIFIEELGQILTLTIDRELIRAKLKQLLSGYGQSWIAAWKRAHALAAESSQNSAANFDQMLDDCKKMVKVERLDAEIVGLKDELSRVSDSDVKSELSQSVVVLTRMRERVLKGVAGEL